MRATGSMMRRSTTEYYLYFGPARIDHFQNRNIKFWQGAGVFFLRDRKIVEWYDYTIRTGRA